MRSIQPPFLTVPITDWLGMSARLVLIARFIPTMGAVVRPERPEPKAGGFRPKRSASAARVGSRVFWDARARRFQRSGGYGGLEHTPLAGVLEALVGVLA
jgi:hypothetical protein